MNNILITCHVEPLRKTVDIEYLRDFFVKVDNSEISVKYLLMYSQDIKDTILKTYPNPEFGLHIHNGKTEDGIKAYKKIFGYYPKDISFGHWKYTEDDFKLLKKYKTKNDYSFSGYRNNVKYFIKNQFILDGINEFPVSCNPVYPINPFTTWYDFFLSIVLIIITKFFKSKGLHLSFHSYDLYGSIQNIFRFNFIKLLLNL